MEVVVLRAEQRGQAVSLDYRLLNDVEIRLNMGRQRRLTQKEIGVREEPSLTLMKPLFRP